MSNYSRADATFGAYAAALGLLVVIVLIMAFVVSGRSKEHIPSVDYGPDAQALSESAEYTVHVPEGLPEGWVPTSSELDIDDSDDTSEPATWTLGFATPGDHHVRMSMSDAASERFLAGATEHGEPDGRAEVGDQTWRRYLSSEEGQRSLATTDMGGATVVVTGTAGYGELKELAGALRPYE